MGVRGWLQRQLERENAPAVPMPEERSSIDQWLTEYLFPSVEQFVYNGTTYPYGLKTTYQAARAQEFAPELPGYMQALRSSPPAFGAQLVRALTLSQARFYWRSLIDKKTFTDRNLQPLQFPWPNCTTGQMIAKMEWHAGLAGNAFLLRQPGRLRLLRPDWVSIVSGSRSEPDDPLGALDSEIVGYVYWNGGPLSGSTPTTLAVSDVCHWSPLPDPESPNRGMSWITPALRDIQADKMATEHKVTFFANGATPNLIVKGIPAMSADQFNEIVEMLESRHTGVGNAYRTLYLAQGADATVIGSDLSQIDFKSTQGGNETRISLLSRVPASVLGIGEGLQGSSLNSGNFGAARRLFGNSWVTPTLQDLAGSLQSILDVPVASELWPDTSDMAILHEDAKDAADIFFVDAQALRTLVDGGFDPQSAIAAVQAKDPALLKHSGKLSVQLQAPGAQQQPANGNGKPPAAIGGKI